MSDIHPLIFHLGSCVVGVWGRGKFGADSPGSRLCERINTLCIAVFTVKSVFLSRNVDQICLKML